MTHSRWRCALWLYLVWLINALTSPISSSSFLFETCCWSCSVNYTRILSLILHLLLTRKQPWCLFQVASRHFSFACWHFSSSSSGPHFHRCCSLLCSRPSLFPFLACWSSAANFTCWCDNTALWNLSHTHTLTFTLFSRYSRKLSVCAVSVQRVMMCRTALKMDQCLHCRSHAVIAPLYFQHHHPISDPCPFALDFL